MNSSNSKRRRPSDGDLVCFLEWYLWRAESSAHVDDWKSGIAIAKRYAAGLSTAYTVGRHCVGCGATEGFTSPLNVCQKCESGATVLEYKEDTYVFKKGDEVQTWFDTGMHGGSWIHGVVIAAGPKAYSVRWKSGTVNRVSQGNSIVKRRESDE